MYNKQHIKRIKQAYFYYLRNSNEKAMGMRRLLCLGETEPYYAEFNKYETTTWRADKPDAYSSPSYQYYDGATSKYTKYNTLEEYGEVDGKTTLEAEDDAATVNMGSGWRTPTYSEFTELQNKCTWTFVENYNKTGVPGYQVTGSNGNSIFLPLGGSFNNGPYFSGLNQTAYYWTSSILDAYPYASHDYQLRTGASPRFSYMNRWNGAVVRAVQD